MTAPFEKAKLAGYDVQPHEDNMSGEPERFVIVKPDGEEIVGPHDAPLIWEDEESAWKAADHHRMYGTVYEHTPDRCPSNHHNGGDDVCTDCGEDLNSPTPTAALAAAAERYKLYEGRVPAAPSGDHVSELFDPNEGAPTTRRVCVLSTLHLTEAATLAMLERPLEAWDCSGGRIGFGFYLYVHDEFDKAGTYPDLARIYAWAKARGFDYVQLDQDEDVRDDLESITEERLAEIAPVQNPAGLPISITVPAEIDWDALKAAMDRGGGLGEMVLHLSGARPASKVWFVEGEHFSVPGTIRSMHTTEAGADAAAAALVRNLVEHVNEMAEGVEGARTVGGEITATNWRTMLAAAQLADWIGDTPMDEVDPEYDWAGKSEGWVEVTAMDLLG